MTLPDYTKLTEKERLLQCLGELLNKWSVEDMLLSLENACLNFDCHDKFVEVCSTIR